MQGFLRHTPEENALRKALLMVYSLSVGCYIISGSFLITMGFLKPESNKVHRVLYCLLGFGSIGLCGVAAIAAKTTEKDALDLATNDYLRFKDQKKDLVRRAYFDETERNMRFEQAKQQMEMAVNGNFQQIYSVLQANIEQQTNQQKLIVNLAQQIQQLKQQGSTAITPTNSWVESESEEGVDSYTSTEVSNLVPTNNRRSLPEVIASNRITQLFVAGTRVGKTALLKACIQNKLERSPNTLFFISACKRNDWFGLEDIQTPEFGYHHSISNGNDYQGIVSQVSNAFSIYKYRAENLTEDEQKQSSPVVLILDDWTAQYTNICQFNSKTAKEVTGNLVSIANNGAGCNVTIWTTGQTANLEGYGFLDGGTRKTMNIACLGRIVPRPEGGTEGGYDAIETAIANKNQLFTPAKAKELSSEYKSWRSRRDQGGKYSIAPLALLLIGADIWFEELEDYTPIIEAAKKNKPRSDIAQNIDLEKTPEPQKPRDKFWDYIAKLEGQILEKAATEKGLTPSDVLNSCSAAVQIRQDDSMRHRISKEFIIGMFKRIVQEGKGRIEESEHNGKSVIRFFST